jgi:hypothetical protein
MSNINDLLDRLRAARLDLHRMAAERSFDPFAPAAPVTPKAAGTTVARPPVHGRKA